jgi:general secretion pathway protein G
MKKYSQGFTLIELLVVIAIIGILAAITLISLTTARQKAGDVKVISDVKQIRDAIESDLAGNAYYPDLTNTVASQVFGGLDVNSPGTTTLNAILGDIGSFNGNFKVVNTPLAPGTFVTAYALYGQLISSTTRYFCLDSTGKTAQTATSNTNPTCP